MAYEKSSGGGKKGLLQSGKGVCTYATNPMSAASRIAPKCGSHIGGGPANADQTKANMLLQKAQKQQDSLRAMPSY